MAIEVKKQEKETAQSLIRRFSKRVQQGGVLIRARQGRFRTTEKSEPMKKRAALRRQTMRLEYQKLAKLGRLPEPKKRRGH